MNKRLFIGGLNRNTTRASLRAAFERFGEVERVEVVTRAESGRSRGFGFIELADPAAAAIARAAMNGAMIDGKTVRVDPAQQPLWPPTGCESNERGR